MFKWLLERNRGTEILCSDCTVKKYDKLFMRESWESKDLGREVVCDSCRHSKVIERIDIG